jgi:hypothetical protein
VGNVRQEFQTGVTQGGDSGDGLLERKPHVGVGTIGKFHCIDVLRVVRFSAETKLKALRKS